MPSGVYERTDFHKNKVKEQWKNPLIRAQMIDSMIRTNNLPDIKEKRVVASRETRSTEEYRREQSERTTSQWFDLYDRMCIANQQAAERRKMKNGYQKTIEPLMNYMKQFPEKYHQSCQLGGLSVSKETHRYAALISNSSRDWDGIFFNTKPEKEMKRSLEELGIHYIFQYPVKDISHCYVADFYLPLYNTILEVDGKWAHNYPDGLETDHIRTKELEESGYRVLRFWEGEFDSQCIWREI